MSYEDNESFSEQSGSSDDESPPFEFSSYYGQSRLDYDYIVSAIDNLAQRNGVRRPIEYQLVNRLKDDLARGVYRGEAARHIVHSYFPTEERYTDLGFPVSKVAKEVEEILRRGDYR